MSVNRLLPLVLGIFFSCQGPIFNLGPGEITTFPVENGFLDPGEPIKLTFSPAPEKGLTERILQIWAPEGPVAGDLLWTGDTLSFHPVPPLIPGRRYELRLAGQWVSTDGRRFPVGRTVPLFTRTSGAPGHLVRWLPGGSDGVSTTQRLVLTFDGPVDPVLFTGLFSIEPGVPYVPTWSADGQEVALAPREPWKNLTRYTWKLGDGPVMAGGAPGAGSYEGSFFVNGDQVPPLIVSVVPGLWTGTGWAALGTGLERVSEKDCLLITTSEPVDLGTLEKAFQVIPASGGHLEPWEPGKVVYRSGSGFFRAVPHAVRISTDLEDLAGNRMRSPWTGTFTPGEPWPRVLEITLAGEATQVFTRFGIPNFFPVCVLSGRENPLVVRVRFDKPLPPEIRALFGVWPLCEPLFPPNLAPPVLGTAAWEDNRTVVLAYKGLESNPEAGQPWVYQFKVPGGPIVEESVWINFATGF